MVAFVSPLAVTCWMSELLGREEGLLPSAGAELASAENAPFSSVQSGSYIYSPELCFSPGLSGEPPGSQVCKLIRQ